VFLYSLPSFGLRTICNTSVPPSLYKALSSSGAVASHQMTYVLPSPSFFQFHWKYIHFLFLRSPTVVSGSSVYPFSPRLHNGSISANSFFAQWSVFNFSLPVSGVTSHNTLLLDQIAFFLPFFYNPFQYAKPIPSPLFFVLPPSGLRVSTLLHCCGALPMVGSLTFCTGLLRVRGPKPCPETPLPRPLV